MMRLRNFIFAKILVRRAKKKPARKDEGKAFGGQSFDGKVL
jgi:hypothetical protein